jgi:hypothetical protein
VSRNALKILPLVIAALALVYQAAQLMRQDLIYTGAQTELSFWGRGDYQPVAGNVEGTRKAIESLLRRSPGHPDYLSLQAGYDVWRAYWASNPRDREQLGEQAVRSQYQALVSRPAHRRSWLKLEGYAARIADGQALFEEARDRLRVLQVAPRAGQL